MLLMKTVLEINLNSTFVSFLIVPYYSKSCSSAATACIFILASAASAKRLFRCFSIQTSFFWQITFQFQWKHMLRCSFKHSFSRLNFGATYHSITTMYQLPSQVSTGFDFSLPPLFSITISPTAGARTPSILCNLCRSRRLFTYSLLHRDHIASFTLDRCLARRRRSASSR